MKIALVHDWFTQCGGAEKVIEQILKLYPQADLYSLIDFFPEEERYRLLHKRVKTSFLQRLPFVKTKYPYYLALMPYAIESFDLSNYDIVLSSSSAVAKGVITNPDQLHICYCNSPMRYAWDMYHEYLEKNHLQKGLKGWIAQKQFHQLRIWDIRSSLGVDAFIANSRFIGRRIQKTYRRSSSVIYPPVNTHHFTFSEHKEEFYLTASRLVPYKKIDLIVEAFRRMPKKRLYVIGHGPEWKKLTKDLPPNIIFLGYQSSEVIKNYMQRAKGFLFAGKEDFGIVLAEAQACGTPVIAYGYGGALEIISGLSSPSPTGCFFYEQTADAIQNAVENFEKSCHAIDLNACRKNAERFSIGTFSSSFSLFVEKCYQKFKQDLDYEDDHPRWGQRNTTLATISEPLSEAISKTRGERLFSSADLEETSGSMRS